VNITQNSSRFEKSRLTDQMGSTQPPGSPTRAPGPPADQSPPHDISALNADTSNVPSQFKPLVSSFKNLFTKFESAKIAPSQKRIVSDASKRVGILFWQLNKGNIDPVVAEKVMQYSSALAKGDLAAANAVQTELTESAWDDSSSHWLCCFKRLTRFAQAIK